jgi:hypothetical protein
VIKKFTYYEVEINGSEEYFYSRGGHLTGKVKFKNFTYKYYKTYHESIEKFLQDLKLIEEEDFLLNYAFIRIFSSSETEYIPISSFFKPAKRE